MKDVWIAFYAIFYIKLNLSIFPFKCLQHTIVMPHVSKHDFVLPYNWWNIYHLYKKKTREREDHQLLVLERRVTKCGGGWRGNPPIRPLSPHIQRFLARFVHTKLNIYDGF